MSYIVDYDGKKVQLDSETSDYLYKMCVGAGKAATGNWEKNHLNIYLDDGKEHVRISVYGLGKVNYSTNVYYEDIVKKNFPFAKVLYNLIVGLNKNEVAPDRLEISMECGKITKVEACDFSD